MTTTLQHSLKRCDCRFCGTTFYAHRADAKTCSKSCRDKISRWRKKLPKMANEAARIIAQMSQYLDYTDSRDDAVEYMIGVVKCVDYNLDGRKIVRQRVK